MPVIDSTMTIKTIGAMGYFASIFLLLLSLSLIVGSITSYDVIQAAEAQTLLGNNDSNNTLGFSLPDLYSNVVKSVVQVAAVNETDPLTPSLLGSGFIYDNVGHILTSSTIAPPPASNGRFSVTFSDGTIYEARVVGIDEYNDLAVLLIEDQVPVDKLIPLPFGNSTDLRIGEQVATIGYPFGFSSVLTTGVVGQTGVLLPMYNTPEDTAPAFSIPDTIVTDLTVNAGNSGGPLFNMQGEVVGMTVSTITPSSISFSIPSNTITKIAPVLIERGSYQHPWIGFSGIDMTPEVAEAIGLEEVRGFLVIETSPGGPADTAGLRGGNALVHLAGTEIPLGGDVILAIDDREVRKIDDVLGYVEQATEVGDTVTVTVWRDGQIIEIPVTVGARPDL